MNKRTKILSVVIMLMIAIVPVSIMELRERYLALQTLAFKNINTVSQVAPAVSESSSVVVQLDPILITGSIPKHNYTSKSKKSTKLVCGPDRDLIQGSGTVKVCKYE